jgi:hypothetical protein
MKKRSPTAPVLLTHICSSLALKSRFNQLLCITENNTKNDSNINNISKAGLKLLLD